MTYIVFGTAQSYPAPSLELVDLSSRFGRWSEWWDFSWDFYICCSWLQDLGIGAQLRVTIRSPYHARHSAKPTPLEMHMMVDFLWWRYSFLYHLLLKLVWGLGCQQGKWCVRFRLPVSIPLIEKACLVWLFDELSWYCFIAFECWLLWSLDMQVRPGELCCF